MAKMKPSAMREKQPDIETRAEIAEAQGGEAPAPIEDAGESSSTASCG